MKPENHVFFEEMNMEKSFSNFHDWCSMFFLGGGGEGSIYLNMVTFRGRGKDSILGSKTAVCFLGCRGASYCSTTNWSAV